MASKQQLAPLPPKGRPWEGKRKPGPIPRLNDERLRAGLLKYAAAGMKIAAVAEINGVGPDMLRAWLARGRAEPDIEPWGSFAQDYGRATRIKDAYGAQTTTMYLAKVHSMAEHPRCTPADLAPHMGRVLEIMQAMSPKDWGSSKHRVEHDLPTGDEYLSNLALSVGQICGILRDPPDEMSIALLTEGDTVVCGMLESGWVPNDPALREKLIAALQRPAQPAPEQPQTPPTAADE